MKPVAPFLTLNCLGLTTQKQFRALKRRQILAARTALHVFAGRVGLYPNDARCA